MDHLLSTIRDWLLVLSYLQLPTLNDNKIMMIIMCCGGLMPSVQMMVGQWKFCFEILRLFGIFLPCVLKNHTLSFGESVIRPFRTTIVLYCGSVPAANAPGCTAAEGFLCKPWSLFVPTCTTRCLHQRP